MKKLIVLLAFVLFCMTAVNAQAACVKCPDIDGDGIVNLNDLQLLAWSYNKSVGDANYTEAADLTGNGFVDDADLACLAADFMKDSSEIPLCNGGPEFEVPEFATATVAAVVLLVSPAFAYLLVRKHR
ncbi:MAG: hypothetical protein JW778_01475 [Candidatus Altiarchaeota archaeon]|nr:hypothetical protein [Candidatus Altiarchaeota archaeon]